jgi:hypothetical protein
MKEETKGQEIPQRLMRRHRGGLFEYVLIPLIKLSPGNKQKFWLWDYSPPSTGTSGFPNY